MAAAAILDFAESEFFYSKIDCGTPFLVRLQHFMQIVRDIAFKPIFKMAAAAILDFSQK